MSHSQVTSKRALSTGDTKSCVTLESCVSFHDSQTAGTAQGIVVYYLIQVYVTLTIHIQAVQSIIFPIDWRYTSCIYTRSIPNVAMPTGATPRDFVFYMHCQDDIYFFTLCHIHKSH